jgi:hypothetical protein
VAARLMRRERRGASRVAQRISLGLTDRGLAVAAETKNLSATGAYCTVDQFIAPMTKLELDVELPDGSRRDRIRCTGVVVRVQPAIVSPERGRYEIAIFFSDLSERDRAAIERFVRQRLAAAPRTA